MKFYVSRKFTLTSPRNLRKYNTRRNGLVSFSVLGTFKLGVSIANPCGYFDSELSDWLRQTQPTRKSSR